MDRTLRISRFPTRSRLALALATAFAAQAVLAAPPAPTTLPTGGNVVAGQASINQAGAAMTINQATPQAILNWQSFSIGASAAVNFVQPSASAVALNRVLGADPSAIYGSLTANGQVFLVNPNGVLFGPGARVDVGGLVASTLNIRDADFLARNYRFSRDGAVGTVVNAGDLSGKYVALLAPEVRNEGVIVASMGTVALAAGEAVTLGISGQRLVDVQVDKASVNTLVENRHLIRAEEGTVILSAQSAHTLLGRVVNSSAVEANGISTDGGTVRLLASSAIEHSGSISADASANGSGGSVILLADLANPASRTTVSGSITARGGSASGDGGFVETSASRLTILDSARVNTSAPNGRTGRWLLDPHDFTIAAVGGDMTGTVITNNLTTTDVEILSSGGSVDGGPAGGGDIYVNDAITWTQNTLTLTAARDIRINAVMTASGTANLALNAAEPNGAVLEVDAGGAGTIKVGMGLAGFRGRVAFSGTGALEINGDAYTVISNKAQLQDMNLDLTGLYALGASFTSVGAFTPVGNNNVAAFTGTFEGLGNIITGLSVSGAANGTGLFGASGGDIRNVGLVTVSIASDPGAPDVGGLVGFNSGRVRNSFVTGAVSAPTSTNVGGLVGRNLGEVSHSYSTANVTGLTSVGGLVGKNDYTSTPGGMVPGPMIPDPACLGDPFCVLPDIPGPPVPGPDVVTAGSVHRSYATGNIAGTNDAGGLVGTNKSSVFFSYATGEIAASAGTNIGGLVGNNGNALSATAASIDTSYSTGKVNNGTATNVGGLVGNNTDGNVTKSFWDTGTSFQLVTGIGAGTATGAVGMNSTNMKAQANFTSATAANGNVNPLWSFAAAENDPWFMYEGNTTPLLKTFMTPVSISVSNETRAYGSANPAFTFNYTDSTGASGTTAPATHLQGTAGVTGAPAATANVGVYPITVSGLFSDQQGYIITAVAGNSVTITPKAVNLTAPAATKVYNGTTAYTASAGDLAALSAMLGVGGDTVTGITLTYDTAAAGAGNKTLTPSLATVSSAAGNYNITFVPIATASITPKPVTLTPQAATKVFDGTTNYTATAGDLAVLSAQLGVAGETVTGITLTFNSAAVGTNKMLTPSAAVVSTALGNYNITFADNATSSITAPPAPPAPAPVPTPAATPPATTTNAAENVVRISLSFDPAPADLDSRAINDLVVALTPTTFTGGGIRPANSLVGTDGYTSHTGYPVRVPASSNPNQPVLSADRNIPPANVTAGTVNTVKLPDSTFHHTRTDAVVTLTAENRPSWLNFDAATGTFTGMPPADFKGPLDVTVTATDDRGLSVNATISIQARAGMSGAAEAVRGAGGDGAADVVGGAGGSRGAAGAGGSGGTGGAAGAGGSGAAPMVSSPTGGGPEFKIDTSVPPDADGGRNVSAEAGDWGGRRRVRPSRLAKNRPPR
jgi:filamentous hemagglutinin family protein